jgi:predicted amidohydrolase
VGTAGRGRDLDHAGGSALIDPLGAVLFEGDDSERVLLGDVEAKVVADVRARFPFLPDRR